MVKRKNGRIFKRLACLALTGVMLFGEGTGFGTLGGSIGVQEVSAAETETKITSMEYYNEANGSTQTKSGVSAVEFGFVMPKFNGKPSQELSLDNVLGDLELQVDVNREWKNIDDVDYFQFNSTWGWEHQFWDGGADGWICWFRVNETTKLRFHGKTNNINLEYTLNVNKLPIVPLTSIQCSKETIELGPTGDGGAHWGEGEKVILFNEGNATYEQIKDDLDILVDNGDGKGFVQLLGNADSGFIWDNNFGIYTEGGGGLWFNNVDWSFTVRFQNKKNSAIPADIRFVYIKPNRTDTTLSPHDGTTFNANDEGRTASLAIVLPKINGTEAVKSDLDRFVYEVCDGAQYNNGQWSGGNWIPLSDSNNWLYQDSGYNKYSAAQQWGYWVDHVFGLWFQPVRDDTYLRIGYKEANGAVKDGNWVYYTFIGNPNAEFPDVSDMMPIDVDKQDKDGDVSFGDADAHTPEGWKLIWNDEFNGTAVDGNNWANQCGFFIDENNADTAGWGNNELEYYTDSPENTSVSNGKLKLTLKKEPKLWRDKNGKPAPYEAQYSSGKLISQNKFSVKYGRVDFRAKLPKGNGIWPALWMMPNDDIYGSWAMSGEIDVFEGRGRTPEIAYGTLHYGGVWPGDLESGDKMDMKDKLGSDMTDWHVYSLVWEEDSIKMYVDGICYMKRKADSWSSTGAPNNPYAPFDQRFYLILNLAAGGYFDGLIAPGADFTSADMFVDYVRVYQRQVEDGEDEKNDNNAGLTTNGMNDGYYGDYHIGKVVPATGMELDQKSLSLEAGQSEKLTAIIEPSDATTRNVSWESSNSEVATVNGGTVKALKAGTTTITAILNVKTEDGEKEFTDTCEVTVTGTVTGTDVTGIKLNQTALELTEGETEKLTATITPTDASNKNVIWSSADKSIATVESDGTVKAVKAGTTEITAKAESGGYEAKCTITVKENLPTVAEYKTEYYLEQLDGTFGLVDQVSGTAEPSTSVTAVKNIYEGYELDETVDGSKLNGIVAADGSLTLKLYYRKKNSSVGGGAFEFLEGRTVEYVDGKLIFKTFSNNPITFCEVFFKIFDTEDEAKAVSTNAELGGSRLMQQDESGTWIYTEECPGQEGKYVAFFNNAIINGAGTPMKIDVYRLPEKVEGVPDSQKGSYKVEYYLENEAKNDYVLKDTEEQTGNVGDTVYAIMNLYTGFTRNTGHTDEVESGKITDDGNLTLKLYYDRDSYDIRYRLDGGTQNEENPGFYVYGVGVEQLKEPVREGYTFGGWYSDASFKTKVTEITVVSTGDVTLYAKWNQNPVTIPDDDDKDKDKDKDDDGGDDQTTKHTVTFDSAGGTSVPNQKVEHGETVTEPEAPTRAGYIFAGWYNGETKYDFDTPVTSDLELTAKWDNNDNDDDDQTDEDDGNNSNQTEKHTVTFDSAGGTNVDAQEVEHEKTAIEPKAPTRAGYIFAGWYNGETKYDFNTPVTSDLELTAKWDNNDNNDDDQTDGEDGNNGNQTDENNGSQNGGNNDNQTGGNNGSSDSDSDEASPLKITAANAASNKIAAGKKVTLTANKDVKWETSNQKYATVKAKGTKSAVVTTKKAGVGKSVKITATATAKDGSVENKTFKITLMNKAVKNVKLTAKTKTVKAGKKVTVKAKVTLSAKIDKKSKSAKANQKLSWKSNNEKYATVSSKGVVTTKKAGKGKKVKITATATDGSGKKASITIQIK